MDLIEVSAEANTLKQTLWGVINEIALQYPKEPVFDKKQIIIEAEAKTVEEIISSFFTLGLKQLKHKGWPADLEIKNLRRTALDTDEEGWYGKFVLHYFENPDLYADWKVDSISLEKKEVFVLSVFFKEKQS